MACQLLSALCHALSRSIRERAEPNGAVPHRPAARLPWGSG